MATVLLVMKRSGNIRVMSEALETIGHTAVGVPNPESLGTALTEVGDCCVAVVDTTDFGAADWHMCQTLHDHEVRFVVLVAAHGLSKGGQSLLYGAVGFLQKPVRKPVFLQLLAGLLGEPAASVKGV